MSIGLVVGQGEREVALDLLVDYPLLDDLLLIVGIRSGVNS
jgi:hypothetical protein